VCVDDEFSFVAVFKGESLGGVTVFWLHCSRIRFASLVAGRFAGRSGAGGA
jgi:hypothetical protein